LSYIVGTSPRHSSWLIGKSVVQGYPWRQRTEELPIGEEGIN
jgi:hypothetical protein